MFTVRRTTDADAPALDALLRREEYNLADGYSEGLPADWPSWIAVCDACGVVALLEGEFDDYFGARHAPAEHPAPQAFVAGLFVARGHRRRGVGRLLLQQFAAEARDAGYTFLTLIADHGDGLADRVEFFRQCGLASLTPEDPDVAFGAPVISLLGA